MTGRTGVLGNDCQTALPRKDGQNRDLQDMTIRIRLLG
jgi:hypothetical protein